MNRLIQSEHWRTKDAENNLFFPWYTRPFLEELIKWDIRDWKVFEYGAGDSTTWWRKHVKSVFSIDSDSKWAKNTNSHFENNKSKFLSYPETLIKDGLFDCIIIDGEPTEWRDDCTEYALKCIKQNGIIIIDNYNQASIPNLGNWPKTDNLLKSFHKEIYKEPNHKDWNTAFWRIK